MAENPDYVRESALAGHGRFSVVPAAYVVFLRGADGDREVLLQLRRGTGFMDEHWACAAAGHVERGESVYAAATREAEEEVGVTAVELVPLTAMPNAAASAAEVRNPSIAASTSSNSRPDTSGRWICPRTRGEVCITRMRGR